MSAYGWIIECLCWNLQVLLRKQYNFIREYNRSLENYFLVVYYFSLIVLEALLHLQLKKQDLHHGSCTLTYLSLF
jgi:hypothetical protein